MQFEALNAGNIKGSILLFSTILNNKTKLGNKEDDFIMKVWNSCKIVEIPEKDTENYSKLIVLIFEHISGQLFNDVTKELLNLTVSIIQLLGFYFLIFTYMVLIPIINLFSFIL